MKNIDPPRFGTWLITGSGGRVGGMLINAWRETPPGAALLRQTRPSQPDPAPAGGLIWDPLTGPLPADLPEVSCLIAYAGVTPGKGADLDQNATLAEATLRAAADAGIPRVLMTSSSAVYGLPAGGEAAGEDDPLRPVNDYGRAKAMMEEVCASWRLRGLEVCALRIGNVAGADALVLNGLAAGGAALRIDQFADGAGPLRSYIGPASLARVTAALAGAPGPLPAALNIAAPLPLAMSALADAGGFPWVWQPAPATAHQKITLDTKALQGFCAISPEESTAREMTQQWRRLRPAGPG